MTFRRARWLAAGLSCLTLGAATVLPTTAAWTGDAAFGRVVAIAAEEPVSEFGEFWFAVGQAPDSVADLSPNLTVDGLVMTRNWWNFQGSTMVYVTLSTDRVVYSASDPALEVDVTPTPSSWHGWFDGGAVRVDADFLPAGYVLYRFDLHVAITFPQGHIPAIGTTSSFALDFSVHGTGPVPDGASGNISGWDKGLFGEGSLLWSPGHPVGAAGDAPVADDAVQPDGLAPGDAVQPDEQEDDSAFAPPVEEGVDDATIDDSGETSSDPPTHDPVDPAPDGDAELPVVPDVGGDQPAVPESPSDGDDPVVGEPETPAADAEPTPETPVAGEHDCESCDRCAEGEDGSCAECDDPGCPARQDEPVTAVKTEED